MTRKLPNSTRKQVLRDYDHKCHFCDTEGDLQVHHIDGHAANHDLDNLIAVCHDCHMNIHYPTEGNETFQNWNDKILPRDERKTGDELHTPVTKTYGEWFVCSECDFKMEAYTILENCPECDAFHSLTVEV